MNTVMTIGYEGATIEDFVETLKIASVDIIIDIRDIPISRKRGFSKNILSNHLNEHGVKYMHMKALGDPKAGRDAAKRGDLVAFNSIFGAHLKSDEAQIAIQYALEVAATLQVCFLCFERDHASCHRTLVVEHMKCLRDLRVRHIGVQHGIAKTANLKVPDAKRGVALG